MSMTTVHHFHPLLISQTNLPQALGHAEGRDEELDALKKLLAQAEEALAAEKKRGDGLEAQLAETRADLEKANLWLFLLLQ